MPESYEYTWAERDWDKYYEKIIEKVKKG